MFPLDSGERSRASPHSDICSVTAWMMFAQSRGTATKMPKTDPLGDSIAWKHTLLADLMCRHLVDIPVSVLLLF